MSGSKICIQSEASLWLEARFFGSKASAPSNPCWKMLSTSLDQLLNFESSLTHKGINQIIYCTVGYMLWDFNNEKHKREKNHQKCSSESCGAHKRKKKNDKKPCTKAGEKNLNIFIVMVTMHYLIYSYQMYKCRTPLPIDVVYRFLGKVGIKVCTKYISTCYIT